MFRENDPININTADITFLIDLPGIGPALADRIIENRPYTSKDELLKVKGIGTKSLKEIQGFIAVGDAGVELSRSMDVLSSEEITDDASLNTIEGKSLDQTATFDIPQEEKLEEEREIIDSEAKNFITRSQVLWLTFSSAFLTFILTIALVLGVLTSLNDGLRYSSSDQTATIKNQVEVLSTELELINQDVEGIRERVDHFDQLGDRINGIEKNLVDVSKEIESMSEQMGSIQENTNRFQSFLKELQNLLNTLFQSEEINDQ